MDTNYLLLPLVGRKLEIYRERGGTSSSHDDPHIKGVVLKAAAAPFKSPTRTLSLCVPLMKGATQEPRFEGTTHSSLLFSSSSHALLCTHPLNLSSGRTRSWPRQRNTPQSVTPSNLAKTCLQSAIFAFLINCTKRDRDEPS